MAIYYNGTRYDRVYLDGVEYTSAYVDGVPVFLPGGVAPEPRIFTVTPDMVTIGQEPAQVRVQYARDQISLLRRRVSAASLVERAADGTTRVLADTVADLTTPAGSSVTFQSSPVQQDATYELTLTNIDGTVVYVRPYYYGRIPTIATFRNAGFRQGIAGITPHQVLLEWNVTGAVPTAVLDITTTNPAGFHWRPQRQQSGQYRYSRQGAVASETLTLTATNRFGTVSATVTVTWP